MTPPTRSSTVLTTALLASILGCAHDDASSSGDAGADSGPDGSVRQLSLDEVELWAYNIQDVHTDAQYEELVSTHFNLYVLETTTTDNEQRDFDMAGLVADIRRHNIETRGVDPIILAYVDVGQAEAWRWYFDSNWVDGSALSDDAPGWMVGYDPNGWEGNYPVAYWDAQWEDIMMYGYEGTSHVDATLDAGFDGIYMDWVEAFSDDNVVEALAAELGIPATDARPIAATRMFDFIEKLRVYARTEAVEANPDYLVIAQNASDLHREDPARYEALMDGIALEAIWYDGAGGFDQWGEIGGYNTPTNDLYPGWTEAVVEDLQPLVGTMPVFCCEYAQDLEGQDFATEVYTSLAPSLGCIPYATQRSLAKLSTEPYPLGYPDPLY